ncbi:hypothetical protein [Mycobacteroides salmoniphilum]|uniref:Uncharacterized protein n=1 Tax=Mycobacteroides salmoniphilum TaxID=404941 RepID=A0A4R8T042_9MYCO|nr:hypothetical protein [Mycobacteroides salmoniphilum]TEA09219.1 hypothetical protein CCUG60884_00209 [Mycobacteroides salmoniphilum]
MKPQTKSQRKQGNPRISVTCNACGEGLPNGSASAWVAQWWLTEHLAKRHSTPDTGAFRIDLVRLARRGGPEGIAVARQWGARA